MTVTARSRTMGPTSDLVVLAPWKGGIIGADEAILPRSRFEQTFNGIYDNRVATREAQELSAFADPVEQIEQVHSYRVAARDEGLLLAVSYDFGWDGYLRALWGPGGPFLDLLLANCDGYVPTRTASLADWSAWIKSREIVSNYFYAATPLTVGDLYGLAQAETRQRDSHDALRNDRDLAGFFSTPPADVAQLNRAKLGEIETTRQALRILTGVYRLTRFYGADVASPGPLQADAITLLRFAKGLLRGWNPGDPDQRPPLPVPVATRFARELAWFDQALAEQPPMLAATPAPNLAIVQRGILTAFDGNDTLISHGALLFLGVEDGVAARAALAGLPLAAEDGTLAADGIYRNLAFTFQGLERLRLTPSCLVGLSPAFRQGAAARAGHVGDVRSFHPAHWQPLPRNWPKGATGTIDSNQVDLVIQLRVSAPERPATDLHDQGHPLHKALLAVAALPGLRLLSIEALAPAIPERPGYNHFGIRDGISQPALDAIPSGGWSDQVAPGELLLGFRNDRGDPACTDPDLQGGSYLAIRRMPMHRDRFEAFLDTAVSAIGHDADAAEQLMGKELVVAKIVGRNRDGTPLVAAIGDNGFTYAADAPGNLCPRQSHARRVNPREANLRGETPPRIARRSLSFGPPWRGPGDAGAERGNMFMAYCASLEDQYELLLRWVNGGNSTRIGSYLADPLCSPPLYDQPRTYRFVHQDKVQRLALPATADSMVQLSWSLYLFAPSLAFVRSLPGKPLSAAPLLPPADPALAAEAEAQIARRLAENADEAGWRNILDEPEARDRGLQRAVWAAIRTRPGGVLVTRDLVLVGSHATVIEVLRDDGQRFSVKGAGTRIGQSIEKFHLGLDACTPAYQREGPACNAALRSVTAPEAYEAARRISRDTVEAMLRASPAPVRIDVVKDLLETVTAAMAPAWFDLPDGTYIKGGVSDWSCVTRRTPVFPGDFWNSSRYAFNPFESDQTRELSAAHGKAILAAATAFISEKGRDALKGSVSRQLAAASVDIDGVAVPAYPTDHDLARGLVGGMLGLVATTLGNGARLLDLWLTSGDLGRLQIGWRDRASRSHADAVAHFMPGLASGIGRQPVPECKWRIVNAGDVALAGHALRKDHKVILSLESAAADQAENGIADTWIWFGMATDGEPTPHGCPGRDLALGMLLGVIAGLAETTRAQPGGAKFVMDISPIAP